MPLAQRWWTAALLPVLAGATLLAAASPAVASTPARELLGAGPGPAWATAAGVARALAYLMVLVAAGGAVFLAWAHRGPDAERQALARTVVAAAVVGVAALALRVPLQAVEIRGPAALTDVTAWERVLASRFGLSVLLAACGLVVVLLALAHGGRGRQLAVVGGAVAVGAFVLTGHSATGEPRWLSVGAMLVHNVAAAVWAGGLVALAVVLRRAARDPQPALAGTVERFSLVATGSVVAVAVAGGAVAWVQVGAWSALWTTDYGRLLAAKVALVAAVVAAGAYNQRRLVPALRREPAAAWVRLRRVVRAEVVGIIGVVVLTAALAGFTPARVAAGIGEIFSDVAVLDGDTRVQLVVDPNRVGANEAHLYLLDAASRPADIAEDVRLRFVAPDGADTAVATPRVAGPGHYLHIGAELDRPGRWRVEVLVTLDGGERRRATFEVVPGRGADAATAPPTAHQGAR